MCWRVCCFAAQLCEHFSSDVHQSSAAQLCELSSSDMQCPIKSIDCSDQQDGFLCIVFLHMRQRHLSSLNFEFILKVGERRGSA